MFKKLNFTVKESKNIRHSDRKAILPESINACFNSKQQFSQLKVAFPNGPIYRVFTHENEPVFFQRLEDSKILYPSVYFLWRHPNKFPVIRIHSSVFTFLQKGSDLMIPGILLDDFPEFQTNSPVAIAIIDDENDEHVCFGPVAVGKALTSSIDMIEMRLTGKKGKAIEILHIFGDHLWAFGSKKELPRMQTVNDVDEDSVDDGHARDKDDEQIDGQEPEQQQQPSGDQDQENCEVILESTEEMDQLLENTFFSAIRWKMEQVEEGNIAPVDAGQFYANFILKNLPPGRRLEIKKTRYKKFSNFLRQINSNSNGWVVQLKTVKGIDSIERINFEHPFIKQAAPLAEKEQPEAKATTSSIDSLNPFLTIHEQMFSLTEQSIPLFRPVGHRKGDLIDLNRIRFVLMEYAQKQNLVKDAGKSIELDDQLQIIFKHFLPDKFPVNTLVQKLSSAMTKTLLVQTRDGQQFVHRGKVPSIEIKIEKRSGNKLVTLVSNLASYGIDAKMLDKEIKGTGTSVLPSVPGCDGPQLLVQGNEVNKIGKLLHDLGLPNKFIKGLELGIKEKKKKK